MTHFVNSQPLSQATHVIAQWAYKQRVHGGKHGGYSQDQQHGLPLTKAGLSTAAAENHIVYSRDKHQAP